MKVGAKAPETGRQPVGAGQMTLFLNPTITDVCSAFLRGFTRQVEAGKRSRRTLVAYEKALRLGAMRWFASQLLADVTTKDVSQMHATLTEERGPSIADQAAQVFSMAVNDAIRQGLAPDGRNPAKLVRKNPAKDRRAPLTDDSVRAVTDLCCQAFLDPGGSSVISPVFGAYFLVVLGLGLRRSEATHLRISEWDPLTREVTITEHKTSKKTGPKVLPANDFVAAVLNEIVHRGWHSVWMFPSKRSRRGHLEDPGKAWARIRKACRVPDRTRIHDLRHTFAAAVYAASRDLKTVQRLLGHSSIAMSSRYAGALPAAQHRGDSQRAMELLLQGETRA